MYAKKVVNFVDCYKFTDPNLIDVSWDDGDTGEFLFLQSLRTDWNSTPLRYAGDHLD